MQIRGVSNELQLRSVLGTNFNCANCNRRVRFRKLVARAVDSGEDRSLQNDVVVVKLERDNAKKPLENVVAKLRESVGTLPVLVSSCRELMIVPPLTGRLSGMNLSVGLCIVATILAVVAKGFMGRKTSDNRSGTVADLVRRGQLRSDRRGISTPLKYEDPFNNPMVKVSKSNSTVEMCGKVYRLAPVTLTDEIQTIHQRRRSRAYQWKRPTVFLKEGESVPPDVDPETVRWIPANHPFATTSSDIDEGLAQNNVYQKHGVPFRIKAEHEALQRKLEALQNDQKLGKLVIDPAAARDLERPLKPHLKSEEQNSTSSKGGSNNPSSSDQNNNPLGSNLPSSEEMH
ncbi:multiple chloroplast division site 1 [Striga asiatica]|uniref:Multiple chloroplast division site 1 n=1 Tax=Striga asiatica TaxID=4170 RepID=A0A5A7QWJ8_STRAF|nr:multiple chloroplast division site 1 [Striga asiatica]